MGLGILAALMLAVGLVLDTEVKASRRTWELECSRAFIEDRTLRAQSRRKGIRADEPHAS